MSKMIVVRVQYGNTSDFTRIAVMLYYEEKLSAIFVRESFYSRNTTNLQVHIEHCHSLEHNILNAESAKETKSKTANITRGC